MPRDVNKYRDTEVHAVTASDGSLVLMGPIGEFLRVAEDGTATRQHARVPAGRYRDCFASDVVAGPGGSVSVVDVRCFRLLTFSPEGAVKVLQLPHDVESESGTAVLPQGISAPPDGSLWFSGLRVVGEKIDSVFGHATPDGAVSYLPIAGEPTTLADAPDGSVWTALLGRCTFARVRDRRIDRFHAPFRVFNLRFAADGGAWLWGYSQLTHRSPAELEAIPRATRCDTGIPHSTFPDARHRMMSLATLRRSGLRVRSNQPAEFSGQLRLAGRLVYVHTLIRRSGSKVSVPLPDALLVRAARRLRAGRRVELNLGLVELRNASGNGSIHSEPYRIVP